MEIKMKIRIITSVVALAVLAAVLVSPPMVFNIALAIVILIMLHECYTSAKASKLIMSAGFVSSLAMMAAVYDSIQEAAPVWENTYIVGALIITILLHMAVVVAEHGKSDYKAVLSSGFLTLYVTVSMSCLALSKAEYGIIFMMLTFVCAWMTDTGAYFTGRAIGKHKLIPHVSPNKTVEGAIGGIVISALSCIIYLIIVSKCFDGVVITGSMLISGAIIGAVSAVFAQLGDLTASAIKRDTGVKDFGWIFPGHGGFMDRFDSVLFISPIIYALFYIM